MPASASPSETARSAAATGPTGATGPIGATGPTGPVGPTIDWVDGLGDGRPGSAPCASPYSGLQDQIKQAKAAGAVVFSTLQYYEQPLGDYSYETAKVQADDFARLVDAGADVVSGSQGHSVQGFGLKGNGFMHYGVGNLFFDQMTYTLPDGTVINGTRREFLDRHVFYDGHYLGVEFLTAMLEDYARPRPMTEAERTAFLSDYFYYSGFIPFSPTPVPAPTVTLTPITLPQVPATPTP